MVSVSENFKTAMKQPIKEIKAFIKYEEVTTNDNDETIYNKIAITDGDDLINYKISCDSGLCKTAMRKLEAKYLGSHNLLGKWVNVGFGVRLPDGSFEELSYGSFLVTELTETKDTETVSIVAYDKMINAMVPYVKLDTEYPIDLLTYTKKLCVACGLELGNDIFGYNLWDIAKQKGFNNLSYDNSTGVYVAEDGDALSPLEYKVQQYVNSTYIENTVVIKQIKNAGIYTFTTKRVENATNIRIANRGDKREFSVFYPIPDSIAVGDVYTVSLEVVDNTVGASKFKNVMLHKGDKVLSYMLYNSMNTWQITRELWENIDGITYRDIFQQIAQATGSTCIIHDDKVYFKPLTNTGESLTYDNLFKLKLEALYGEINSVVLSRAQIEGENVSLKNDASIQTNGLTEFKIESNEIIDKDRENAITPIFDALYGISYYPFEATTEGLGWYEIGDNITIVNDLGEEFKTSLFNYTITIDGSVKETLKTTAESKTQTQYQYATTVAKQIQKNTEIIVNKQEQYIKSLVEEKEDDINKRFTAIEQDIENINFSVQNSGGSNLIKNSVMFATNENGNPNNWTVEGDGTLTIESNADFLRNGGVSAHGFTLSNKIVRTDKIPVKPFDNENPLYYSFSTKLKTEHTSDCKVRIYNLDENEEVVEEYILDLTESEATTDGNDNIVIKEFSLNKLMPIGDYYIIEFSCVGDSEATFTDNMFSIGEQTSQWVQANGEVMNTQVNISLDGVVVKSITYAGDYTVISPLEFAGYSKLDANSSPVKVFTLNKGITEVKELLAKDGVSMPPLKIVPVTSGDMQGWAFVVMDNIEGV